MTNNSRVNVVALCRFTTIYMPGRPEAEGEIWAKVIVEVQEMVKVREVVPLPSVEASAISSSLVREAGLRRVRSQAI